MDTKRCPNCGLVNAASAMRCDCGLVFASHSLNVAGNDWDSDEVQAAIRVYVQNGVPPENIVQNLASEGINENAARQLVRRVLASMGTGRQVSPYSNHSQRMFAGVLVLLGGIVVTGLAYLLTPRGGTFIIFSGLIAIGMIQFCIGLFGWVLNKILK